MIIEEDGFVYNKNNNEVYYEQALKWSEKNECKFFTDIIRALVNPSTIENDVNESEQLLADHHK